MSELRFDGRSVIVTGGGRGFGRCHAHLLASRGARVVVADYGVELDGSGSSPEPAELVAKEIESSGGEAVPCFANVADVAGAELIVQTALDAFGGIDVVVNNAGIYAGDWFDGVSLEQFRRMVDYHYLGTVNVCKAAWPHLKTADHGCIVNTSSEAIIGHIPKSPDYAGAKGAVFSFTKALALNGRMFGIRVNAVAPRGNTRMSSPEILAGTFDQPEDNFRNEFFDQMRPEYVSPAVAFLAHDSCPLTGEVIVCGGLLAMRVAIIETKGLTFTDNITPEDLAENLDRLMDPTDANVMGIDLWT
ncbi:MAG TPA: SDR family NAD(P)-dependent oxidoreductase [Acidimicrobiales bacterium]|nr:SDR family NAD(P)-dependent oxidoreductase [Acidimicrobiales bacterium]